MKYRKLRVLYDLSGRHQEEITQYQGFLEVAEEEGWSVLAVSERIETQIRRLCDQGKLEAVVGRFVSEVWVSGLPPAVKRVHMGMAPLGASTPCVVWDLEEAGRRLRAHLTEQGYEACVMFHPQDLAALRSGLGAEGFFRTSESLRGALSGLRNGAVVCPTDYGARLACRVARQAGVEVPGALGIAGVGGRNLDAVLSEIPLTSVRLPYREKGRRVGELLRERFQGGPVRQVRMAPGRVLPGESTRRRSGPRPLAQQVEGWVGPHLREPPPVAEWARRAGMSRRGFERAFAGETGVTPYEYLLGLREREAKRLLRETDWPLARIGAEIGIPDPPRFSAFFKKRAGVPASVWRRG